MDTHTRDVTVRSPRPEEAAGIAVAALDRPGMERACLDVDTENTSRAVAVYRNAGMSIARRADLFSRTLG